MSFQVVTLSFGCISHFCYSNLRIIILQFFVFSPTKYVHCVATGTEFYKRSIFTVHFPTYWCMCAVRLSCCKTDNKLRILLYFLHRIVYWKASNITYVLRNTEKVFLCVSDIIGGSFTTCFHHVQPKCEQNNLAYLPVTSAWHETCVRKGEL